MKSGFSANKITLSPWVNEPLPPLSNLLTAHDVARLTRRSKWTLLGLRIIGQFPRSRRYRGRGIGWLRSDVIHWLAQDLRTTVQCSDSPANRVSCGTRQVSLPLQRSRLCRAHRRRRHVRGP